MYINLIMGYSEGRALALPHTIDARRRQEEYPGGRRLSYQVRLTLLQSPLVTRHKRRNLMSKAPHHIDIVARHSGRIFGLWEVSGDNLP